MHVYVSMCGTREVDDDGFSLCVDIILLYIAMIRVSFGVAQTLDFMQEREREREIPSL